MLSIEYWQSAKTKQAIKEEEMQITVIERAQNIQVQEQEIIRRERELEATIRKPAEAEKFKLEKLAEANKYELITYIMPSFRPSLLSTVWC